MPEPVLIPMPRWRSWLFLCAVHVAVILGAVTVVGLGHEPGVKETVGCVLTAVCVLVVIWAPRFQAPGFLVCAAVALPAFFGAEALLRLMARLFDLPLLFAIWAGLVWVAGRLADRFFVAAR